MIMRLLLAALVIAIPIIIYGIVVWRRNLQKDKLKSKQEFASEAEQKILEAYTRDEIDLETYLEKQSELQRKVR